MGWAGRPAGREFQIPRCEYAGASKTVMASAGVTLGSFYKFYVVLIVATSNLHLTSCATSDCAPDGCSIGATSFNFSVEGTSYACGSNVICLGQAHIYAGDEIDGIIQDGMLSLTTEKNYSLVNGAGSALYNRSVRLLDSATQQSASFSTAFAFYVRPAGGYGQGDGMTFFMSESNVHVGSAGKELGFFDSDGATSFKSIVVEFDMYQNPEAPFYDISANHVSFDFSSITPAATENSSEVMFYSSQNVSGATANTVLIYAWVDYSSQTQMLEVRVSYNDSRPMNSLLNYTVDLFDVAAEYMWVGFSGANSGGGPPIYWVSNYYIGNWSFESYGIAPFSPTHNGKAFDPIVGILVPGIVGVSIGVLVILFLVIFFRRRLARRHMWQRLPNGDLTRLDGMPERFSYETLSVATGNFSEESKLGHGAFGSVYRGILPSSGAEVAVKKLNADSTQGEKEFMAEVSIINQARHRNLIQLRGWCIDKSKSQYLLVFDLMSNGSLDKWLFPGPDIEEYTFLSWSQRFNIVGGIALGLEYLHQGCVRQVIHRDIKSSNVMLDDTFNVKLGDFGLSRLVDHQKVTSRIRVLGGSLIYTAPEIFDGKSTQTSTVLAGTPGYLAPETLVTSKCVDKTDVYAFGVVVLEVMCGRRAYISYVPDEEKVLVDWVWQRMSEGKLLTVVESRLSDYDPQWMEAILKIGLLCSHDSPECRPSMGQVVRMLDADISVPPIPPRSTSSQRITICDFLNQVEIGEHLT